MTEAKDIPPDRNDQIKLLFEQDLELMKDMAVVKKTLDNQQEMIAGINRGVKAMEKISNKLTLAVIGDPDIGVEGLIKTTDIQDKLLGKHSKLISKVSIGAVVALWFLKEFGILDKFIT